MSTSEIGRRVETRQAARRLRGHADAGSRHCHRRAGRRGSLRPRSARRWQCRLPRSDAELKPDKQLADYEAMLTQEVDIATVAPVDAAASAPGLRDGGNVAFRDRTPS